MSDEILVEKPKKRTNSKRKGSQFEGHIGKILGDTLAPMKFKRSQSSGAILGGANEKFLDNYSDEIKTMLVGDVVPTNESDVLRAEGWKFRFTIECKFYQTPDNISHLFNNSKIKGWFEQAYTDSLKLNKEPILIFKFNHTDIFCAVNDETIGSLPIKISQQLHLVYNEPYRAITILLFKEALLDLEWWKYRAR